MGTVYADITLKNATDIAFYRRGLKEEEDVRSVTVTAKVDTGAPTIVINEELREKLGLDIIEERRARMADGRWVTSKRTNGIEIHWKDRNILCQAMLVPGAVSVLLGVIPLEWMDLIVDPLKEELVGAHGDEVVLDV